MIEKQSSEEEMQPIEKKIFLCVVFATCKENEVSFCWLINYKGIKVKKNFFSGNLLKAKMATRGQRSITIHMMMRL